MRRFAKKPNDCKIVRLDICREEINKKGLCLGIGSDDEPIECCKQCRYCESGYFQSQDE